MVLVAENISFHYESKGENLHIINDLSFSLNAGESVAIVGASGSGKSTLLHLLAGLDRPQAGKITLCGQVFSSASDGQKSALRNKYLGFVYQFHHLLPEFSALENVALPLLIAGTDKKSAFSRAQSLLEKVGLSHRINHLPAELSGGERQRTAIARALVNRPACLMADEPTGNLDQENAQHAFQLMQELVRDEKSALIIVTHDLNLAKTMQKVYQLKNKSLEAL